MATIRECRYRWLRLRELNLLAGESRISGGSWWTIKGPPSELRCSPIRKQSFCNSGSSDVADSRYQAPRFSTLDGSAWSRSEDRQLLAQSRPTQRKRLKLREGHTCGSTEQHACCVEALLI